MLDQDFCELLEEKLTEAFSKSKNNLIRSFWCDGILLPTLEKGFSQKSINDMKQVSMTAFIGNNGQDKYQLLMNFGNKSLSKYVRGLDIKSCVPDAIEDNWFEVDEVNKKLSVYLL